MMYKKFADIGAIVILAIVLALLMESSEGNIFFDSARSLIGVLFLMYIPGYLLVDFFFHKKFGRLERLFTNIGISVSLTILIAMVVYFLGLEINIANILSIILIVAFMLIVVDMLKKRGRKEIKSKIKIKKTINKNFYLHLFLAIVIIAILSYMSAFLPSKEEFVRLQWATSEVTGLKDVNAEEVSCAISNCSLLGVYKVGKVELAGNSFNTLITDLDEAGRYDVFCIDLNGNGKYCNKGEGPYRYYETFFIGPSAFTSPRFDNEKIVFANFPEYIFIDEFTTSFVFKSFYSRKMNFIVTVSVNGTSQYSETLELGPGEETIIKMDISLPTEGQFKVRADIRPTTSRDPIAFVYFWVDRRQ